MPETVIRFASVTKSFGNLAAVDGISFSAAAGETVALLGPSGCGKTTTLRLIAGFEDPDHGSIEIGGESMVGKRPYERNVGLLFQHYALFPHMTVAQNIAYGLKHRQWPKAEIAPRIEEMLRLVQLAGYGDRRPQQLSGGQQQRVALARVLATKPRLVLLDEPLSALDAKLREELRVELKEILTAVGSTTIVVTHDQDEAMGLADRIIVMNRGRIDQQGAPDEIYSKPATRFVASFMGRSNWLDGTIKDTHHGPFANVVLDNGLVLTIGNTGVEDDTQVSVGIRPERITLGHIDDDDLVVGANQFAGTIEGAIHMGAENHYRINTPVGPVMVVRPNSGERLFTTGEPIRIGFCAEDCMVYPSALVR
ncbi:MAG: ABC transporter ATP-binding protein [Paracoccaceae bacterium]